MVNRLNSSYRQFVLSVDEVQWTNHWLDEDRRCDQLRIFVGRSDKVRPLVHLRAIESKSRSQTPEIDVAADADPFESGIEQVVATLKSIRRLIDPPDEPRLVEDLRFSSFMEHVFSVALGDADRNQERSELSGIVGRLTRLSLRELPDDAIGYDGVVACTQVKAAVADVCREVRVRTDEYEWNVLLVRAGSDELNQVLTAGPEEIYEGLVVESGDRHHIVEDGDVEGGRDHGEGEDIGGASENVVGSPTDDRTDELEKPSQGGRSPEEEVESEGTGTSEGEVERLAEDLYYACQQRGFPVKEPSDEEVAVGPTLIGISMPLETGASLSPIENAVEDLAREIGAPSVSVENDPDRAYHIRFKVGRRERQFPSLPSVPPTVASESGDYYGLRIGARLDGSEFVSWMSDWPHMLVGGGTGSGKTTFLKSILVQLGQLPAGAANAIVVDGKGEGDYIGAFEDHLLLDEYSEVVMGSSGVLEVLDWVVEEEVERRRQAMLNLARERSEGVSAREMFTDWATGSDTTPPCVPLVIVIDEFSEIMLAGGENSKRFEERVQQVAQAGRSRLVHLVLATQRPDAKVVSGSIKANLNARVALSLPTHHDSMTILGQKGAEDLLGNGDMLFRSSGQSMTRLQGYAV